MALSQQQPGALAAAAKAASEEGGDTTLVDLGSTVGPTITGASGEEQSASTTTATVSDAGFYYTINRQAGIISANATFAKHRLIKNYLERIKMRLATQVLIEAKIIEVTLTEEYSTGINWSGGSTITGASNLPAALADGSVETPFSFQNNIFKNVTTALSFIENFGTVRALSNPRLMTMNNQQAIFTFAQNKPYFTIEAEDESDTDSTTSTLSITSTLNTVPIGIMMSIQPSINLDTQEITLNVRPTVSSDIGRDVPDPGVQIIASRVEGTTVESNIPTIEVRELDTVLKIKNDEVMVIGGLLQHLDTNIDTGAPFFSSIPIIGNLAKKTQKTTEVKELIILITAKIVTPEGYTHNTDRRLFNKFTQDPRPLTF